ncbi:MAG: elongation factor P [Candidatus Peribacteraceae bacterium]
MINATQIRVGNILKIEGALFRVLKVVHITPGKGNAQIQADLRNIRTGIKTNMRFRSVESVEEVVAESKEITFLYQDGSIYHFMDPKTYEQYEFPESFVEDVLRYLKPEATYTLLSCDGEQISVSLPQKMSFTVVQCDPAAKGIAGATKDATVDNGSTFKVPLFIKPGDVVVIDTETGDYFEKG